MEPINSLRVLRQRRVVVWAGFLAALVAAWITAPADFGQLPQTYTASHVLYRDQSLPPTSGLPLETIAVLAKGGEHPHHVIQALQLDLTAEELTRRVEVTTDARASTLTVTATGRDPTQTKAIADAYARTLADTIGAQERGTYDAAVKWSEALRDRYTKQVGDLESQLAKLPARSAQAQLVQTQLGATIDQLGAVLSLLSQLQSKGPYGQALITIQGATPVAMDSQGFTPLRSLPSRLAVAALLGLALGAVLALVLDRADTKIRSRDAAEAAFGLPVVADIPKLLVRPRLRPGILTITQPASAAAEAYRGLRLALQVMPRWVLPNAWPVALPPNGQPLPELQPRLAEGPARVVLVTSPGPAEGKTTTVANLAASFSEVGKVVLVLDCDFRHPELHQDLGREAGAGVADFLARTRARPALDQLAQETEIPGVWFVPSGRPADAGHVLTPDQDLINTAAELADVVLIDTGPVLAVSDPAALMPAVDAVVVVARSGETTIDAARRTTELLARLEAPVLGVALVGVARQLTSRRYAIRYYEAPAVPPQRHSRAAATGETAPAPG